MRIFTRGFRRRLRGKTPNGSVVFLGVKFFDAD